MSDDRTDDELRADAAISARIDRVIAGDSTAAFASHELRFAPYSRCECGAELAYPLDMGVPGAWYCSAILRGVALRERAHYGATTRDAGVIS